ncbi:fibro-slime domain-containing protein [Paraliomyxa miuraensis]|uniref:fibro-slime domain-containing protein n=1 Tax=Paraliomyxa miuraensis TaxID=376150 RepID=UPI002257C0FF|nr:fibro-slime domain-containing protein [Paraliomyxa miuraensis]MCX4243247.1 fibro-slime domain-containing protein [Paraliomyxa miuraensis]
MRMRACLLVLGLVACGEPEDGRDSGSASGLTGLTGVTTGVSGTVGTGGTEGTGMGVEGDASIGSGPTASADDTAEGGVKFDLGTEDTGTLPPPGECETDLVATVRDFSQGHPDFESVIAVDPGIVQDMLGGDGKPVYAGGTAGTTTGQANFDQWYRDVAGVNVNIPIQISLTDNGDETYTYDDAAFFPIDGQGLGNEGNPHNYHFTLEMHTQFTYQGGEVFTFRGDDDLFTFINGRLGIDLGGVHGPIQGSIDLDAMAGTLGIVPGGTYDLDFFFAERHTSESNFRIETTIGCFHPPG